jgi:protein involved in polysaccharide export with SLBB domain
MDVGKGWSSGLEQAPRRAGSLWRQVSNLPILSAVEKSASWKLAATLGLVLCLLTGCAVGRPHLDEALLADSGTALRNQGMTQHYRVGCPDVLEVRVAGRSELGGRYTVKADGRIDLGGFGRVRVEGLAVPDIASRVAGALGATPNDVGVRVAEYNSQQVYLVGEVTGLQRAVPYQGPETVLDLLQRTGGITPGAAPGEVHVIHPGVAEGQAPQVFHIDLQAVVLKQDQRTNVRLQPFDQVYVGESEESCLAKCVPPCFRCLYDSLWGMRRGG